ncbi:DUF2946 domain-containing protein [Salinicola avicenniae]|uniref:DUF2946 domain-containing protein n=1 Tax=Salinicola avicenniae TaxID=2916836 RepID=UPI0020737BE8|nr:MULTISPECIES: DUF2946 domain-containing protein [unclassified Salinicola]
MTLSRLLHRWYRTLTAVALFAMTMAFVGPLISQTQRLLEAPTHGGVMTVGTSHGIAHDSAKEADATHSGLNASHHWHMAACSYCELFLHAPGLTPPRVIPPVVPPPRHAATPAAPSAVVTAPAYPRYATRAPPPRPVSLA